MGIHLQPLPSVLEVWGGGVDLSHDVGFRLGAEGVISVGTKNRVGTTFRLSLQVERTIVPTIFSPFLRNIVTFKNSVISVQKTKHGELYSS